MPIHDTPKLPPPYAKNPLIRLREIICIEMMGGSNPADRQKFSKLLDLLNHTGDQELPSQRPDGRSDHPAKRAVVYAGVLRAIRLIHAQVDPQDIEAAVRFVEWAWNAVPGTFQITGDQGKGFTMEKVQPSCE